MNEIEKRVRVFTSRRYVGLLEVEQFGDNPNFIQSVHGVAARSIGNLILEEKGAVYSKTLIDDPKNDYFGGVAHEWRVSIVMPLDNETDFTKQLDEAGARGRRAGIEAASNLLSTMGYDSLAYSVRMIK